MASLNHENTTKSLTGYGLKTSIVRGKTKLLASSLPLGWEGFGVEHHLVPQGLKEETETGLYIVSIAAGNQASHGQRANRRGLFENYLKEPRSIGIFPSCFLPAICPVTPTELIVCAFERSFVESITAENNLTQLNEMPSEEGVNDPSIVHLGRLLTSEATDGGASGALYVEHLAHALVLRLLARWGYGQKLLVRDPSGPEASLKRVIDMMRSDPARPWSLAVLAQESGFSRNYLLHIFRTATGYTPHRYLLQLRVEKAKALMCRKRIRLIDIAASCGFSSEAHLSRVFRSLVGASPSQYRGHISK